MKESTKAYWIGMLMFIVGSILFQVHVETTTFLGGFLIITGVFISFQYIEIERGEKHIAERELLHKKIKDQMDEHLELLKEDAVRETNENDFIKRSEHK